MPPSRFSQVSRYRNAVLSQSKPEERFSELALLSTSEAGSGKLVAVTPTSSHIFARSAASPSSLIILPHTATRKYGKQPPILQNTNIGPLGDFDLCNFQQRQEEILLATGSLQGDISLQQVRLPEHHDHSDQSTPITLPLQDSINLLLKVPSGKPINLLQFHPTCSSLFLTASSQDSTIHVWDANASSSVLQCDHGYPIWDAKWSPDGRQVAAFGKDSIVRIWDPRNAETSVTVNAHASKVKPGKVTFISASQPHLLLTTGFSQMRQREISIHDQRNPASPLRRITLDVASSALEPLCDYDRGIVYMVAKGESSIRWVDVGSEDQGGNFAEGAHALNVATTSATLAPAINCDTGVGEIAKLFIASSSSGGGGASAADSISPVSVRVPRRTYIDFHSDLYPLTPIRQEAGCDASKWLKGEDGSLALQSLDPAARGQRKESGVHPAISSAVVEPAPRSVLPVKEEAKPVSVNTNNTSITPSQKATANEQQTSEPQISKTKASVGTTPPSVLPRKEVPLQAKSFSAGPKTHITTDVHWSRRFLAGSTPLVPSFQNLTSLDISRAPAARMITVSTEYLLIPIAGPGGRLGVHPLNKEGRLPLHLPSFQHGSSLGDFVMDPFNQDQVITSAADGVIRVWKIPAAPLEGQEWPSSLAEQPLSSITFPTNEGSNKVGELCPHPHADGLLAVIPADADGKIHLINVRTATILKSINVPAQGLYSTVWSPDGSVLAGAGKDRQLYILDVRGRSQTAISLGQASAHDSPRPFNIVWIDDIHLLTVGHTTGSLRQLKLFKIDYTSDDILTELAKHNLDVSPSILFPFWDADVNILWVWSKGERLVSSFEVQPDNQKEPFLALTTFQHNHPQLGLTFMRKDCVNVREVEVDASVRLCKEELQKVAWKITRSRPEYFQDDIYQPSVVIEQPLIDSTEWLAGKDAPPAPRKSLQPEGMVPLSQAPPVVRTSNLPKGPIQGEKTDKEREEEMLTSIFEKAKGNDEGKDPNHNEDQAARAPDEDDWGSD